MSLSADDVRKVASLARLELGDEEVAALTRQLTGILDYFAQLAKVETDGTDPMAHPFPLHNVFRADETAPSLSAEAALANAPQRDGDFYAVPAVLD